MPARPNNLKLKGLISRIKSKQVIPVIGQGLYRVNIASPGTEDCLLYDYLAEKITESCEGEVSFNPKENHKFAKACFEYLRRSKNDYLELSYFLKETLQGIQLVRDNSVCRLARIKNINMFINTAYDNFLTDTIKEIRNISPKVVCYGRQEKDVKTLDKDFFDCIDNSNCPLVYHLFGNLDCIKPAYTEKDILETILTFQEDMKNPKNYLQQRLKSNSLLFIGCGYDDWLFRFFIRAVANKPYEKGSENQARNFVGEEFRKIKRDPFQELPRFLENHDAEIFRSTTKNNLIDLLVKEIEEKYPDEICSSPERISAQGSPLMVFISYEGKDKPSARCLAKNLSNDGINVWLDGREFKGGDDIDQKILNAINKCSAFIALVSKNSQQIQADENKLKYHIREWEHAFANKISRAHDMTIIPVYIDDTKWVYDKFRNLFHFKILKGKKTGDYEKLKNQLLETQKNQDKS